MADRIIFSIHIDIPTERLDNPAAFDSRTGEQLITDKSKKTKDALNEWADDLIANHRKYAECCNADYVVHYRDASYERFIQSIESQHPQLSEYDIINFYKHWLMKEYSNKYKEVCYFDLDVVTNTEENIFEAHDIYNKFACKESNQEARAGKRLVGPYYNKCIRNPASKYWNAFAMLLDAGYSVSEADTDVFNTGIMLASAEQIKKLDYFSDFDEIINDMQYLKDDTSVFHKNVVRSFNYDNETVFAYKRVDNSVEIDYIDMCWHTVLQDDDEVDPDAKIYHVIHKRFEELESILRPNR